MMEMRKRILILLSLLFFFSFVIFFIDVSTSGGTSSLNLAADTTPLKNIVLPAAPNSTQPPTFENPHDLTYFYARARNYGISVNITDPDGFASIDYVNLSLFDNSQVTEYWTLTYDEDTNQFSKNDPLGYITLVTGSCSYWKSSDDLDILFVISIDWDHPDITDTDTRVFSIDSGLENTTNWYETNWDVETQLDYLVSPSVTSDDGGTVDRGDLDEAFHITGTVEYYGSTTHVRPPSNQVDVWVSASQYGTNIGPWIDSDLVVGAFDVTCYADDQVGQDTYTVKVVEEGTGSGGTDLYHTSSVTDTYIADQIQVQSYTLLNASRVGIGVVAFERVVLFYAYNLAAVVDGTVTVNGISAVYSVSLAGWVFSDMKVTTQAVTYNAVAYSGGTHSLDGTVDQNGQASVQIWDALNIVITDPTAQRININTNASGIVVTATYDYDGAVFNGTLMLNDTTFQYSTVGRRGYTVVSASGGLFPLVTAIGANDETYCIWDRLIISIQASTATPSNDQEVTFNLVVTFDYDDAVCTTYQLVVERNGTWWNSFSYSNRSAFIDTSTDAAYEYTIRQITSESLYGITVFSSNLVTVAWSAVLIPVITLPLEVFIIVIVAPLAISTIALAVVVNTSVKLRRFTREWKKAITYSKAVISSQVANELSKSLEKPYQALEKASTEISNLRSDQLTNTKVVKEYQKQIDEALQQVTNAIKELAQEDFPPYVRGILQSLEVALDKLQTDWLELITTLLDLIKEVVDKDEKEQELEKIRIEYQTLLGEYKNTIDELRLIIAELVQVGGQPGG